MKKISRLLAMNSLIFSILSFTCATVINKLDVLYFNNIALNNNSGGYVADSYIRVFHFNRLFVNFMYIFIIIAILSIIALWVYEIHCYLKQKK